MSNTTQTASARKTLANPFQFEALDLRTAVVDSAHAAVYALNTAPHWAGGFGDSFVNGTEAMCHPKHVAFFMPIVMVGVLGSCLQLAGSVYPVRQPDTLTARSLATPRGVYSS